MIVWHGVACVAMNSNNMPMLRKGMPPENHFSDKA
jgi:hypothetical protein